MASFQAAVSGKVNNKNLISFSSQYFLVFNIASGKELSEKHFYKTDLKNKAIKNRICICKNCLKEKRNNTHEYIQRFKDKCICCGESDVACLDFHHLNDKYESYLKEKENDSFICTY